MQSFLRYITLLSLIFAPLASKAQMADLSEVFIDAEVVVEDTDQTPAASVASTIIAEAMKYLGNPARFGFPVFVILNNEGQPIHIQESESLEEGKGYSEKKVIKFLSLWTDKAVNTLK